MAAVVSAVSSGGGGASPPHAVRTRRLRMRVPRVVRCMMSSSVVIGSKTERPNALLIINPQFMVTAKSSPTKAARA